MKIRETDHGRFTSKEIIEASFEEWIDFVFSKDVTERDWISGDDFPNWSVTATTTLDFIEKTFRESASVLANFSNSQLSNGLNFIHNASHSDTVHLFQSGNLPLERRISCLQSIWFLYSDCFAKRCDNVLSNWNEVDNPLNGVCYMWWDIFVLYGNGDSAEEKLLSSECLSVMKSALEIDHVACQESALHGLGHWQDSYPNEVSAIINDFLESHSDLESKLRNYARAAQRGGVQ